MSESLKRLHQSDSIAVGVAVPAKKVKPSQAAHLMSESDHSDNEDLLTNKADSRGKTGQPDHS